MKKADWQGIIFLIIIFILGIGLSYLSLNKTDIASKDEGHVMSIALVNEDEGALFNDEYITFGDDFVKSVDTDSKHEWYVVSRGVAENGFERNNYDMMIVIPNDFSEKSLSIHLDNPEPVSLHYRINATGHKDVRAEAEKTAGKILNNFNQRLIDVYFASVIGNLQEAQDSINEIIEKEIDYTNEYYEEIHTPLSGYTDRFERLQYYAENSREGQDNFDTALEAFASRIADDAEINHTFADEINTIIEQTDQNGALRNNYQDYFNQFVSKMDDEDVQKRLRKLQESNNHVYEQFKKKQKEEGVQTASTNKKKNEKDSKDKDKDQDKDLNKNLVKQADDLQKFLEERLSEIGNLEEELYEEIYNKIEDVVEEGLSISFDQDDRINDLFPSVDENMQAAIEAQINALPTLGILRDSALSDDIVRDVNRIIRVSNQYKDEFNFQPNLKNEGETFDASIEKIKDMLVNEGITVTDEVTNVPVEDFSNIEVSVPKGFQQAGDYKVSKKKESNGSSYTVNISVPLKLKQGEKIDIFKSLEWEWKINTEGKETNKEVNAAKAKKAESAAEDVAENEVSEVLGKTTEAETADTKEKAEIENNAPAVVSETIITKNYFKQKVQSPIKAANMNEVLSNAADMLSKYYQLEALYDLYFDFDGKKAESEAALAAADPDKNLTDQASKDSLYYLLHKMEVKDALTKSVAANMAQQITEQVQDSLDELNEQMGQYKELVDSTTKRTDKLIGTIDRTQTHAKDLNDSLKETLGELTNWHEASSDLAQRQSEVLMNDEDMTMRLTGLGSSYQPILSASESLKDQAKANFSMSDHVYKTIETLESEADAIESSGTNLVARANLLADKLMDKAVEDADFADNFNDVLANSRVGDRQNDQLYHFLSNPVQTKNDGTITNSNNFIPYYLMLILFIITFFTAYVFSQMDQRRLKQNPMADATIIGINMSTALILAGIGLLEGLVTGLVSFFLLQLSQGMIYAWIGFVVLITMIMLFVMAYLLRQLKMIGMFLILAFFSIYLLLTRTLGFQFENAGLAKVLRDISPLQYFEGIFRNVLEVQDFHMLMTFMLLFILAIAGLVINLFVIHKGNEGSANEEPAEAN